MSKPQEQSAQNIANSKASQITCCIPEKLMFKESRSNFDFETTIGMVKSAFKRDWIIPWETNIQERYKEEGFQDMTRAILIPICRPAGGYDIIQHDRYKLITPLMPLQISVYEKTDGNTYISRMKTVMMSNLMSGTTRRNMKESGRMVEASLADIIT